jgi:hypothetical protein
LAVAALKINTNRAPVQIGMNPGRARERRSIANHKKSFTVFWGYGNRMEIIEKLEATRDKTLELFQLSEAELGRSYGPGKWSVRFILHHLADAETVLFDRIRRVLSEGRRVIWAFDQDAWAKSLDYSRLPLTLSRNIYQSTRAGIIYYARIHYDEHGLLEFVHNETGVRTLKDEFDKVAGHNQQHLEQIRTALSKSQGSVAHP